MVLPLLFENVKGHKMPVFANAFGTMERMCLALSVNDLDEIGTRIRKLMNLKPHPAYGKE